MSKISSRRLWFSLLVAAALVGCREAESITTYEAPRTEPKPQPVDVEKVRNDLDHMLAAIVPQDDKAWFFKLVVRGEKAADELRKPFRDFVSSIKLGEGDAAPTWTLPEGWEQKPGNSMRVATIEVPQGDQKLELAASTLPLSGEWAPYVEVNVNRWMGQLQQAPLSAETVAKLGKTMPIESGGEATVFELVGVMKASTGMGAMPAGHPPVGSSVPAATAGSTRPVDQTPEPERSTTAAASSAPAAQPREFKYEMPAGWKPGQSGGMRKAAFNVAEEDQQAEVTVMPFPANAAMADPTAQAARWAGQVGLQLSEADLKAGVREVKIDGMAGQQFELLGPDDEKPLGILAAMVRRGEQVWFFKMFGDRALVDKQRDAFSKFVESVKFTPDAD
jgi:hypothetical protein